MIHEQDGGTDLEGRLSEALLAYLDERQAGREPDREAFLAANPDLRGDLALFIDCHEELARMTAPLRMSPVTGAATTAAFPGATREGGHHRDTAPRDHPDVASDELGELGDFRLLRELGRGGMGVVYMAEQLSLRRRVALKVLPFAAAVDARRLQRFKTEALAAANLQHEGIVPVHAVGCERGVHYYAMPYIEGQSLAGLIAELRLLRTDRERGADPDPTDRPGLNPTSTTWPVSPRDHFDRVADLGRQAAQALEYAPPGRDRASGCQAEQPPARPPGPALDHRLRPGAGHGRPRADDDRRAAGHPALRQSGAAPGPAGHR